MLPVSMNRCGTKPCVVDIGVGECVFSFFFHSVRKMKLRFFKYHSKQNSLAQMFCRQS